MRLLLWWTSLNIWARRGIALCIALFSIVLLASGHSRLWLWFWIPGCLLFPFTGKKSKSAFGSPILHDAMRRVYAASSLLTWWRMRPQKALEILEPLHTLQCPDPEIEESCEFVKSTIFAATGDCYSSMERPLEAAHWYRKAAACKKTAGGFAYLYADMVLRHQLAGEYESALECLEKAMARRRELPLILRALGYFISPWWLEPQMWRLVFTQHRFAAQLRARIADSGNQPSSR